MSTAEKSASKSNVIRAIVKKNPKATVKTIETELKKQGVDASVALINKIKYGRKKKVVKRRKINGHASKADSIRAAWSKLGMSARPKDVIAHLAGQGIKVTSAQVSTARTKAKANKSKATIVTGGSDDLYGNLLTVRSLVDQVGGVENATDLITKYAALFPAN